MYYNYLVNIGCMYCIMLSCMRIIILYLSSVLDDQELFEDQKYFPLDDLRNLTLFLNSLVFAYIWDHTHHTRPSSSPSSLSSSCIALFSLLLQRNKRAPFLTENNLQVKLVYVQLCIIIFMYVP